MSNPNYNPHPTHCNQGEYIGSCKYGDLDCPQLDPVTQEDEIAIEYANFMAGEMSEDPSFYADIFKDALKEKLLQDPLLMQKYLKLPIPELHKEFGEFEIHISLK